MKQQEPSAPTALNQRKKGILSLDAAQLAEALQRLGEPAFRAKQVFQWLHQKGAASFEEMTNLPAALRTKLAAGYQIEQPEVALRQVAADGTEKMLLRYADGQCVEAVLMHYRYGVSLCISSQVGCRMGCTFCASSGVPFARNLSAGEMAGEVYAAERASGKEVKRIVLMGIGEPLDNYNNVVAFIRLITSPVGKDLSGRHISLSTCGLVPEIERLAGEKLPLTLSVSLHAAKDDTRGAMMPVNRQYPISRLLAACRAYQKETGRRVSFEYALAAGVNDSPKHAQELANLLEGMGAHVNLIPVNAVRESGYSAAKEDAVAAFCTELEKRKVTATVRRRLGADIDAACGQLRAEQKI